MASRVRVALVSLKEREISLGRVALDKLEGLYRYWKLSIPPPTNPLLVLKPRWRRTEILFKRLSSMDVLTKQWDLIIVREPRVVRGKSLFKRELQRSLEKAGPEVRAGREVRRLLGRGRGLQLRNLIVREDA